MLSAVPSISVHGLLAPLAAFLAAQTTTIVSVDSQGVQGSGGSWDQAVSANGRFVAFWSLSSNLVADDSNALADVFVRDLQTGATTRVSIGTGGVQSNAGAGSLAISADGRFVGFESAATNLVPSDTNGEVDVFVHDRLSATTVRVSVDGIGAQASGWSRIPSLSGDGRFVAFLSSAADLIAGDTNGTYDVFVRDSLMGTTSRASVATGNFQSAGPNYDPCISADGRYVAFQSGAADLVWGDTNGTYDIFVHDRATVVTTRVSVDSIGTESNAASWSAALSGDGRFVAFHSGATNLVPEGNPTGHSQVFVRDLVTGVTSLVSATPSGAAATGGSSHSPSLSSDGRFVVFVSRASDFAAGDLLQQDNVFLRDRISNSTEIVSLTLAGRPSSSPCLRPSISGDGRSIVFDSEAANLVAGDSNSVFDVFLSEVSFWPVPYCTSASTTVGCTPSISSTGAPSASAAAGFVLDVSSVNGQRNGIFFYGISGPLALPWAAGSTSYLCVKPPTQRTSLQNSGGTAYACDGALSLDWLAFVTSNPGAMGQPLAPGQRVNAQAWFRDPPAPKSSNLSNALEFDVVP